MRLAEWDLGLVVSLPETRKIVIAGSGANPQLNRRSKMLWLVVVYAVVSVPLCSLTPLCAQALISSSPTFMVATIKPSDPNRTVDDESIGFNLQGGSFDAKSQSLKELIEFAQDFGYYRVDQRILGGPKWIASAKFDIEAKCEEETALALRKMTLKQQLHMEQTMVQALIADRFKLRTHREMKRLAVYALVQEKSGSKIRPSTKADDEDPGGAEGTPGNWKGNGVTMSELASELSALPEVGGRTVIDRTDLKGKFDFTLRWTPDPTMGAMPAGSDRGVKSEFSAPPLLTALREQLGLRLDLTKEDSDVIVVDSAELPTVN